MINLIVSYLPYVLLFYFLIRSLKEPFFLLGIPFLMFFRYSIFFDSLKIFIIPASLGIDLLLLLWLLIIWIVFSSRPLVLLNYHRTSYYKSQGINWLDFIVIALLILSVIDFLIVLGEHNGGKDIYEEFFTLISLFLGFFIIKNCFCFISPDNIKKFFYSIVLVNSIASVLYILHQGLHIPIYPDSLDDDPDSFLGMTITRTFWFIPVLWYFSISYLLTLANLKSVINISLFVINVLAISVSYNRSSILIVIGIVFIYSVLSAYKKKNLSVLIKYMAIIGLGGAIFFFAVAKFLPVQTKYFMERFKGLKKEPADEESNTLVYRFARTHDVFNQISDDKKLVGSGPVTEKELLWVEDVQLATSDMVWAGVAFRWGYIGLLFFGLLYVISLIKALNLFINSEGVLSYLALLFLLNIVSQMLEGFVSWTFMSPGRFAMGLWYFGILSALTGFNKKENFSAETV